MNEIKSIFCRSGGFFDSVFGTSEITSEWRVIAAAGFTSIPNPVMFWLKCFSSSFPLDFAIRDAVSSFRNTPCQFLECVTWRDGGVGCELYFRFTPQITPHDAIKCIGTNTDECSPYLSVFSDCDSLIFAKMIYHLSQIGHYHARDVIILYPVISTGENIPDDLWSFYRISDDLTHPFVPKTSFCDGYCEFLSYRFFLGDS